MESTKWYASKTMWANIIAGIVTVGSALGLKLPLDADTQVALVGGIMAVVNIILRLATTKPITGTNGT